MRTKGIVLATVVVAVAWPAARGDRARPGGPGAPTAPALILRGAYLVNDVARCGDCHTPRDAGGRLDKTRHLQGAPLWFRPRVKPKGEWEDKAPDITMSGKGGKWTEEKLIRLLTTGKGADAPMPAYHFSQDDARAVAAYLRSLPGKKDGKKNDKKKKDDDD